MENSEHFSVYKIILGTFGIIRNKPIILLPLFLFCIVYYIQSYMLSVFLDKIFMISDGLDINEISYILYSLIIVIDFILFSLFIQSIIIAMYPLLIKNIMDGKDANLASTFSAAWKKRWSIFGATILVELIVSIGFIFLVIPGLIFLAYYYYTIPAIMLDDLGAGDGMITSKNFANNIKLKTFFLYSIPILLLIPVAVFLYGIDINVDIVDLGMTFFYTVWLATTSAYTYITYGQKNL